MKQMKIVGLAVAASLAVGVLAVELENVSMGQSNGLPTSSSEAADWGKAVQDVRMSVSLSNRVLVAGSTVILWIQIENASKGTLWASPGAARGKPGVPGFEVFFVSSSGRLQKLTPEPKPVYGAPPLILINPGEAPGWRFPITIKEDTDPGDYTLKVTQRFRKNDRRYFDIESNRLEVQVVRQSTDAPPDAASWGKPVQGVRLSITLSNDIVAVGEETTLSAAITNSSTNSITLAVGFTVLLTSDTGKIYQLVTPVLLQSGRVVEKNLEPGGSRSWNIPLKVRGDIKPGNYTLEATKSFSVSNGRSFVGFRLVSNDLKVQVK
jgi:hypothetical protein